MLLLWRLFFYRLSAIYSDLFCQIGIELCRNVVVMIFNKKKHFKNKSEISIWWNVLREKIKGNQFFKFINKTDCCVCVFLATVCENTEIHLQIFFSRYTILNILITISVNNREKESLFICFQMFIELCIHRLLTFVSFLFCDIRKS